MADQYERRARPRPSRSDIRPRLEHDLKGFKTGVDPADLLEAEDPFVGTGVLFDVHRPDRSGADVDGRQRRRSGAATAVLAQTSRSAAAATTYRPDPPRRRRRAVGQVRSSNPLPSPMLPSLRHAFSGSRATSPSATLWAGSIEQVD